MLKNYFKVIEDFQSSTCHDGDESLSKEPSGDLKAISVEKGEIIMDVKECVGDSEWVIGKELVTQKMGKIPRKCIEMLQDTDEGNVEVDGEKSGSHKDTKRCGSSTDSSNEKRVSSPAVEGKGVNTTPKRASLGGKAKGKQVPPPPPPTKTRVVSAPPGQTEVAQPVAPPRQRKSNCESDSFRSRGSDEGYNSSSHYSGEKPAVSEPIVNPIATTTTTGYCNATTSDAPQLSSFKDTASPKSVVIQSPRPSITDADGYEIPIFTQRSSIANGEVASSDEKGVTLKFIFNRKSTAFEEKSPEKETLNAIGEYAESAYETWSTDPKNSTPNPKTSARREKILVTVFMAVSLLLSLGIFFLMLFVGRVPPLLCFTVSVNIFAILCIGLLTTENKRWLCIGSLLVPCLFSNKVKIGLCVTLCAFIVAAPVCNFSSNMELVLRCKNRAAKTQPINKTTDNAETLDRNIPRGDPITIVQRLPKASQRANTTVSNMHGSAELRIACVTALRAAISTSLDSNCSKDSLCPSNVLKPRIQEICRNLSVNEMKKPLATFSQIKINQNDSFTKLQDTLLQLLPLLLLLILHEAYRYNRDYLSNKEMDNVYITGKLKALDCERKNRGMRNKLFPLRKLEFRKYVLPSFFLQTSRETRSVLTWLIIWFVLGVCVLLVILLDKYIYNALVFMYEDSQALASCDMKFKAIGVNMIYSLCFILAILLIAVIIQSYILRARSRICSFFYPKVESARGVYLYHKILHDRLQFWKACRERGCTLSEARRTRWKIGIGHKIYRVMPLVVQRALKKLFIYRCMICDSLTCRKSFVCTDQECYATFCYECYIDMGQTCISCRPHGIRDSVFTSV
eukprot:gene20139-22112_t